MIYRPHRYPGVAADVARPARERPGAPPVAARSVAAGRRRWGPSMDARIRRLYWQLTALGLACHFAGWTAALPLVLALNAVQVVHVLALRRSLRPLDAQVRLGYLALLLLGTIGPLWPIHVVQFVGVNALLVADYCPLARALVLLPWNRQQPLTPALLRWLALVPPAPGSIVDRLPRFAPASHECRASRSSAAAPRR